MLQRYELAQKQSLPLKQKISLTKRRIISFYEHMHGNVYVSFSGGKDSTVLLDIVRSIYPGVLAVFCDTGLEYPEIKKFVKTKKNVQTIRPTMSFHQVIKKHGYPVISKEQSMYIRQYRRARELAKEGRITKLLRVRWEGKEMRNGSKRFKISEKWKFLVDAPFVISERCCDVLKKRPFKKFERKSGLKAFLGNMASDSLIRRRIYLREGCTIFEKGKEKSMPLSFWLEKDIWDYIKTKKIPYSSIYDKGIDRTGCIYCMFGIHKEKINRFEVLKKIHPKLYDYCMNVLEIKKVLDYIKENQVKKHKNQSKLNKFAKTKK